MARRITQEEFRDLITAAIAEKKISIDNPEYWIKDDPRINQLEEYQARLTKNWQTAKSLINVSCSLEVDAFLQKYTILQQIAALGGPGPFRQIETVDKLDMDALEQVSQFPRKYVLEKFPGEDLQVTRNVLLFNHITGGYELPTEMHHFDPYTVKPKELKKMIDLITLRGEFATADNVIPAINLVRLFNNFTTALQYIRSRESLRAHGALLTRAWVVVIHSVGQIPLPKKPIHSDWGKFILSYPSLVRWSMAFHRIQELNGNRVPANRDEFDKILLLLKEEMKEQLVFMELGITGSELEDYTNLVNEGCKTHNDVPMIRAEIENYSIETMAHDDIRQAAGGLYSDCCQHLHGAASDLSRLAYKNPKMAIWGIRKQDQLIGQAAVWVSSDEKMLVIDSVEAKSGVNSEMLATLIHRAAKFSVDGTGYQAVLISGSSGFTKACSIPGSTEIKTPKPHESLGDFYTDTAEMATVLAQA